MEGRGSSSSPQAIDTGGFAPMEGGNTLPGKQFQRHVFKLQQRIYRAARRGDGRTVRKLHRRLIHSRSARGVAVRQVTQENPGKKTAGGDGGKSLTPPNASRWLTACDSDSRGSRCVGSGFLNLAPPSKGPWAFPCWRTGHARVWSTRLSNPKGRPALNPTVMGFDRAEPVTMRAKRFSRPWAIKPHRS